MAEGSGILTVNCRGCGQFPDVGSPVCIRCMTAFISKNGTADRIQLKAGKDTEVSGPAAEILCDLAMLNRPDYQVSGGKACESCMRSPSKVLEAAWADFPDPSFSSVAGSLYSDYRDGPECALCLQRTHSALLSADANMEKIRKKAALLTENKGLRA